ncbi:HAMP domain-containing sensor histidine kinase [Halobacteriovorax sp. XZX-3]|uniref:sensor histidine kinase n=1 Tax=unclassified Halobacteriovorax TaxID=2639665 RepID=UPI00371A196C
MKDRFNTLLIHFTNVMAMISLLAYAFRHHHFINDNVLYYFVLPISTLYLAFYYFDFKGQHTLRNISSLFPSIAITLVLITSFGGIHAPGVFWIAGFPIFFAIFFRKRGMIIGISLMLAIYTVFYAFEAQILSMTVNVSPELYMQEKRMNVIHFSIVITLFFLYYTWLEQQTRDEIEQSKEQLDTLLHVVLHDLSNPITILKLKLSNLKRRFQIKDNETKQIKEAFSKIEEIIQNIRSFQMSSENLQEDRRIIESTELKSYLSEQFRLINKKHLKLIFKDEGGFKIKCSPSILKDHILSNLLTNAVKFSHPEDIIEVTFSIQGDSALLSIRDEGIGIPEELMESIFEFDKKTTRPGTIGEAGTGYGLPIVHYFVELSGAKIFVHSPTSNENGTEFTLSFPLRNHK